MTAASLLALALTLAPTQGGEQGAGSLHVDAERGFELRMPEGWVSTPQPQPDGTHTTYFLPAGSSGSVLLGVSLRPLAEGQGVDDLVSMSLAKVAVGDAFDDLERFEAELAGELRPGLRVRYESPTGPLIVEVGYVAEGRRGYALQRAAPPSEFESWRDEFDGMLESFRLLEVEPPDEAELLVAELAARCGSQVDVAPTWEEAARHARELGRPILVVAWAYGGFDLPMGPDSSLLTDPDVVALLRERFVVWRLDKGAQNDFSRAYGLSPTTFGQALIVADADGTPLAEIERATDPELAHAFLRGVLADAGGSGAATDDAALAVDRGELERALELLEGDDDPRAALVRARALRLAFRGEGALGALEPALRDPATRAAALVERAQVELRTGDTDAARATAGELVERHPDAPEVPQAALLLGLLDLRAGDPDAARARWLELCASHPDHPATWQAAEALGSGLLDIELGEDLDLGWPDAATLDEVLRTPPPASLPTGEAGRARDGALAWLLDAQREDGSWPSAAARGESPSGRPNPFVDSVTALAARALLAHRGDARVDAALERAYAFLLASIASRAEHEERILYMDYTPWSDAALLDTVAAGLDAGVADEGALHAAARDLVADLAARRQPHGGWGYYVTGDLDGAAAPPTSMSFTTAAVVLALSRARAAGCDVSDEVLDDAATALESMRSPEGHYVYMQGRGATPYVAPAAVPGAAGRAPACELALLRTGRSDDERLRTALDVFLADSPSLAAERGKALMHCGAAGQGCHYVLFDYAWAAAAYAALDPDPESRARLRQLVLDCRRADGSFFDTPINGRAYGTAQALLALDALE